MRTIDGPMGPFWIPSEPSETSRICEGLSRAVWGTRDAAPPEYEHPDLPVDVSTILDIGGGWGAFSVWALQRWPDALIEAYEPHHAAIEYFVKNAPDVLIHECAVTIHDKPLLCVNEDWGGCSVYHVSEGLQVPAFHPRDLPACDILKIDAEGVEPEIVDNYPHLAGLKALIYEFHHLDHRDALRGLCQRAGLRQVREDQNCTYGSSIWLR